MARLTKKCPKCISRERDNEIIEIKQHKIPFQAEDASGRALISMHSKTTVEISAAKMPFRAEILGSVFGKDKPK